jgi:hypothetical protein
MLAKKENSEPILIATFPARYTQIAEVFLYLDET